MESYHWVTQRIITHNGIIDVSPFCMHWWPCHTYAAISVGSVQIVREKPGKKKSAKQFLKAF